MTKWEWMTPEEYIASFIWETHKIKWEKRYNEYNNNELYYEAVNLPYWLTAYYHSDSIHLYNKAREIDKIYEDKITIREAEYFILWVISIYDLIYQNLVSEWIVNI